MEVAFTIIPIAIAFIGLVVSIASASGKKMRSNQAAAPFGREYSRAEAPGGKIVEQDGSVEGAEYFADQPRELSFAEMRAKDRHDDNTKEHICSLDFSNMTEFVEETTVETEQKQGKRSSVQLYDLFANTDTPAELMRAMVISETILNRRGGNKRTR